MYKIYFLLLLILTITISHDLSAMSDDEIKMHIAIGYEDPIARIITKLDLCDGNMIIACSHGNLFLYSKGAYRVSKKFKGHSVANIYLLNKLKDRYAFASSAENTIIIWDLASGEMLYNLKVDKTFIVKSLNQITVDTLIITAQRPPSYIYYPCPGYYQEEKWILMHWNFVTGEANKIKSARNLEKIKKFEEKIEQLADKFKLEQLD